MVYYTYIICNMCLNKMTKFSKCILSYAVQWIEHEWMTTTAHSVNQPCVENLNYVRRLAHMRVYYIRLLTENLNTPEK